MRIQKILLIFSMMPVSLWTSTLIKIKIFPQKRDQKRQKMLLQPIPHLSLNPLHQPPQDQQSSFLNSSKWGKELRPPFLKDNEVFNKLSLESAANQIMQWMTTKAMITWNELKEKKANNAGDMYYLALLISQSIGQGHKWYF